MAMSQVSVGRVVRRILVTTVLAALVAPAAAQENYGFEGRETQVRTLGGTTRFSPPMRTVDDFHAMVNSNRDNIRSVLTMVGLADVSTQIIDALATGPVTDATIAPGTHLYWMGLKRGGRPDVLRNVRWSGR